MRSRRWRDLQDITLIFGSDRSRFYEYNKRAIFDRDCGPLVKMLMTRCIHRTRCVRFLSDISGTNDFGMLGRGEHSEIGTYIRYSLIDELSANIIDLCPVGALTSKPYAFKARPWELSSLESIDVMDCMASNLRVDFFNNKVYRILPIYDKNVNEDWITNKARFIYDSNNSQRIIYPLLNIDNKPISITWKKAIYLFFFYLNKYVLSGIYAFFGSFNDLKLVKNISNFFNIIGTEVYLTTQVNNVNLDFRCDYLSDKIVNIFENINNILFVGINIRLQLPLLNARLRKLISNYPNRIKVYYIGLSNSYHNIPLISGGNCLFEFINVLRGRNKINCEINYKGIMHSLFVNFKLSNLMIFFKDSLYNSKMFDIKNYVNNFLSHFVYLKSSLIYNDISILNIFELNVLNTIKSTNLLVNDRLIFLENVDDQYFLSALKIMKNDFVIYHGQFMGISSNYANLIIPSYSIYEYNGTFINMEGRIRKLTKVISNNSITSYDLFTILKLCYNKYISTNYSIIKKFRRIIQFFEFLDMDWSINYEEYYYKGVLSANIKFNNNNFNELKLLKISLFNSEILNYYKTNIYSLNSKNMHLASLDYLVRLKTFI